MSPTQYRAWKNEVQANSAFFTKFLEKHPTVTGFFLTAFNNGVIFQSESEVAATQKLVKQLMEQNMVVAREEEHRQARATAGGRVHHEPLLPPRPPSAKVFPARLTPRRRRMFC